MRVLVVSQLYHPEVAAAPIRLKNMTESLQQRGYEVDVLTAMPNYPTGKVFEGYRKKFALKETRNGSGIYRYWIYANNSFNKYKRMLGMVSFATSLWAFAFKWKTVRSYDIVIVQTPPLIVAYSAIKMFRLLTKAKIVLNVSDIHPLALVHEGHLKEGSLYHKMMCRMEKYVYRKSDALMGQSEEILRLVNENVRMKSFLYRTLQKPIGEDVVVLPNKVNNGHKKLVYAGLLSKTQNILSIIEHIDFKGKGLELHLYGDGNQKEDILKHCDNQSIFYHGTVSNSEMMKELKKYDASIIPLSFESIGAVPSKIYNVVYAGLPVIYMGMEDGEAAQLISSNGIGMVAGLNDFKKLEANINKFNSLSQEEYAQLVFNCERMSQTVFNYEHQMERFVVFLDEVKL